MRARIYKRVRLEDATKAVLRGQNYVGKYQGAIAAHRREPSLPKLKCQEHGPEDYDDPAYRRWPEAK